MQDLPKREQEMPSSNLVRRFAALFRGYDRAYGTYAISQVEGNGKHTGKAITRRNDVVTLLYERHLQGEGPGLGIIPLREDDTVYFGAIDYDNRSMDHVKAEQAIRSKGLPLILCRSKSGGGHFYCFLKEPVPAHVLCEKLADWRSLLGMPSDTEIFPKQISRPDSEFIGNYINLPYYQSLNTVRYAIIDGKAANLERFLDHAEAAKIVLTIEVDVFDLEENHDTATDVDVVDDDDALVAEGQRNNTLFKRACALFRAGMAQADVQAELLALNTEQCTPPLSDEEIQLVVRNAIKYGGKRTRRKVSANSSATFPSDPFYDVQPDAKTSRRDAEVHELNRQYAVVLEGNRALIWTPTERNGRLCYSRLSERDFSLILANRFVQVPVRGGKTKRVPLAKYWLEHPDRREYDKVLFDPSASYPAHTRVLNLWRGFTVTPAPGIWSLFDSHLREVCCSGDSNHYIYLRKWLARSLQHPELMGETAVVMRGEEGCGKGTLGNAIVQLFGQHGLRVDRPGLLTGQFNSHLSDCAFLFADEATWGGDKSAEGILKGIVTEPNLIIERKYQDAASSPNRLTLMMASNNDWVIPAGRGARRFFVLDVADTHVGDDKYFAALHSELASGGLAAFTYDMLNEDLTGFNHRDVPITQALQEQVLQNLSPIEQWWLEKLNDGRVLTEMGDKDEDGHWPSEEVRVVKDELHRDFIAFLNRHQIRTYQGRSPKSSLGRQLRKLLPKGWPKEEWRGGPRGEAKYVLPSLGVCRNAFSRGRDGLFTEVGPIPRRLSDAETHAVMMQLFPQLEE